MLQRYEKDLNWQYKKANILHFFSTFFHQILQTEKSFSLMLLKCFLPVSDVFYKGQVTVVWLLVKGCRRPRRQQKITQPFNRRGKRRIIF